MCGSFARSRRSLKKRSAPTCRTPGSPASTARGSRASLSSSGLALDGVAPPGRHVARRGAPPPRRLAPVGRVSHGLARPPEKGRATCRRLRHRRRGPRQRADPRRRRPAGPAPARLLQHRAARRRFRAEDGTRRGVVAVRADRGPGPRPFVGRGEGPAARRGGLLAGPVSPLSRAVYRPDELVHEPRRDEPQGRVPGGGGRRDPRHAQLPETRCDSLPHRRRGLAVRALEQGPSRSTPRLRDCARHGTPRQGLAHRRGAAEARRGGRRLVPRLGQGPLPAEAPRPPRRDEHPRRRPPAAPPEAARGRGRAPRALREAPGGPEALRLRLRVDHRRGVRRGLPDAPGARRSSPPDHECAADPLRSGAGGRPGDTGPPPAPGRALPRSEARRDAGGHARDTRPGLRGPAHRARLGRPGEHGPDPQSVRGRRLRPPRPSGEGGRAARAHPGRHADRRQARRAVPLRPARSR